MDYEKKYKETLERARKWYNDSHITIGLKGNLKDIFPELAEPDDERIRKMLIEFFGKGAENNSSTNGISDKDILAWLEKQGNEPKVSYTTIVETGNGGINALVTRELPTDGCDDEQEPADKVKPKFKVGDWIIRNAEGFKHNAYLVTEVKDYYVCEELKGSRVTFTFNDVHKNFKLWDITKDAKDGDVLYTPKGCGVEGIFLIEGWKQVDYTGRTLCSNIGYRVEDDEIIAGGLGAIWWKGVIDPFYPATKEQRDLLFQKMKEAGYEWDAKKKELKKTEQKPVSITDEWIEDYWQHEKVINPYSYDKGEEIQFDHQGFVRFCKKYCRKPAWSEEDEKMLEGIVNTVKDARCQSLLSEIEIYDDYIDWLKSLKQRYTWKSSDEQVKALYNLNITSNISYAGQRQELVNLYNDLKKLKG